MKENAFIQLGSNLGNRSRNLSVARAYIKEYFNEILEASAIYESEAWGVEDQRTYLNQVVQIRSSFSAEKTLELLLEIENLMGRERQEKWGSRNIDLDLLFFGDQTMSSSFLTIPHPHIQDRLFVLKPMMEIAPQLKHPIFSLTIAQLFQDCTDKLKVWNWETKPLES